MNILPPGRSGRPIGRKLLSVVAGLLLSGGIAIAQGGIAPVIAGQASGSGMALNPQHPERYVVKKGDTLWDIAAMFLRDPWYWPEIWYTNPQVANPHLIYPGDVLVLVYVDGRPQLRLERDMQAGGESRLSPRIRTEDIDEAITAIPFDVISAFLSKGSVLTADEIDRLPYIVALRDGHLIAGAGHEVYVRGDVAGVDSGYSVVHIGDPLVDPDTNTIVGYEGIFVGEGTIRRGGDPATLELNRTNREALEGDRLVDQEFDIPLQFIPRPPERNVEGRIIHVVDGVTQIGQYQIVVMNRGAADGLEAGHVLTVWQLGDEVQDKFTTGARNQKVKLPDERAGTVMIFKTYDDISYGLIMRATSEIHVLDKVQNPG